MSESFSALMSDPRLAVAAAAAIIGLLFGILSESSQLCLFGGLRETREQRSNSRLAAYAMTVFAAMAATQALIYFTGVDLKASVYLSAASALPGIVLGGLLFGFGSALSRGCAGRLTILAASGNMRALTVIVVLAIAAYATMRGILAPVRLPVEAIAKPAAAAPDLITASGLGNGARIAIALVAAALSLSLFRIAGTWRGVAALGVGILVAAGWAASGILGDDGLEQLQPWTATFVAPLANGLQYLMTFTGAKVDFGIAFVAGVLVGALISSIAGGRFRLHTFESPQQTLRYLLGALLMGFGGILALGCTTGQGFAGISVLAPMSFAALASIAAGMWLGLLYDARKSAGVSASAGHAVKA